MPISTVDHRDDRAELRVTCEKTRSWPAPCRREMATMPAALAPFTPGRSRRSARNSCSSSSSSSGKTISSLGLLAGSSDMVMAPFILQSGRFVRRRSRGSRSFSGSLPNQAEPGKFRRRNFAHAGPDLHKTELAGIHHPVDGRTTNPGGLAEFGNADADARDRCMCPWSAPLLPDWGMFDRHWEPPLLSGRLPLFHKISV